MISRKKFMNFFDERFEGIIHSADELSSAWNKETLHQLRVNAKKVKAVAGLLQECSGEKKAFKTRELKALFKHAGNIRTAELHLETFAQNNITVDSLVESQTNIISTESEKLCNEKESYLLEVKTLHERLSKNVTTIKNRSIVNYYRNGLAKLCSYFIIPIDVAHLHESRKLIKNLLYPLKLMPLSLVNKLNLNEEYLDYQQDIIGKWRDAIITLELLDSSGYTNHPGRDSINTSAEHLYSIIAISSIDFNKKIIG
jgi:CHAD domain-containing protein